MLADFDMIAGIVDVVELWVTFTPLSHRHVEVLVFKIVKIGALVFTVQLVFNDGNEWTF